MHGLVIVKFKKNIFAARCYASAAYAVMRCQCVCLSVTFVNSFSPSGSQNILVYGDIPTGPLPPNGGVKCRWGRQKSRFWANIWLYCVLWTVPAASAIHLAATDHGEFTTLSLVSGRVCWWWETTTKCMTRSLNVTPKTTLRSGKSEA